MNQLKQVARFVGFWLMLCGLFLGSGRAAAFGYGGRIDWRGDIERHEAMRTHATGDQISLESKHWLKREACGANRTIGQQFEAFPVVLDSAFFQPNLNDAVRRILRADNGEYRPFIFQQVSDPDLDLSVLIAQCHYRLCDVNKGGADMAALALLTLAARCNAIQASPAQTATFRISFIRFFSCPSMHWIGTSATQFRAISCLRTLVLQYLAATPYPVRATGRAAAIRQAENLRRQSDGGLSTSEEKL
jgi:hypothetical protein